MSKYDVSEDLPAPPLSDHYLQVWQIADHALKAFSALAQYIGTDRYFLAPNVNLPKLTTTGFTRIYLNSAYLTFRSLAEDLHEHLAADPHDMQALAHDCADILGAAARAAEAVQEIQDSWPSESEYTEAMQEALASPDWPDAATARASFELRYHPCFVAATNALALTGQQLAALIETIGE
jgi:hypothetical protein